MLILSVSCVHKDQKCSLLKLEHHGVPRDLGEQLSARVLSGTGGTGTARAPWWGRGGAEAQHPGLQQHYCALYCRPMTKEGYCSARLYGCRGAAYAVTPPASLLPPDDQGAVPQRPALHVPVTPAALATAARRLK